MIEVFLRTSNKLHFTKSIPKPPITCLKLVYCLDSNNVCFILKEQKINEHKLSNSMHYTSIQILDE